MSRSMTGFGRCLVENSNSVQEWEIRSVNSRYFDLKWHLPAIVRYMEPALEKIIRQYANRGRVEITLTLRFSPGASPKPLFDSSLASAMLEDLTQLAKSRGDVFKPDYAHLLMTPSLWSDPDIDQDEELAIQLESGLKIAIEDWNESRDMEGQALERDLQSRFQKMDEWTEFLSEQAPLIKEERINSMQERIRECLTNIGSEMDENRFLQEVVILADKLDVSEELTRLFAHLEHLRHLLRQGEDSGRRLDFTLQECMREINTCGAKISDAQLSHVIVDFKNEIEKCREQVQNLE